MRNVNNIIKKNYVCKHFLPLCRPNNGMWKLMTQYKKKISITCSFQSSQAALETVRCEELQLELKSTYKTRSSSSKPIQTVDTTMTSSLLTSSLGQGSKYTMATTGLSSIMANNTSNIGLSSISGLHHPISTAKTEPSTVTWAPTPDQKSSEIDRIMAKIEQARLSIANVCVLIRNHKFSQNIYLSIFC